MNTYNSDIVTHVGFNNGHWIALAVNYLPQSYGVELIIRMDWGWSYHKMDSFRWGAELISSRRARCKSSINLEIATRFPG